YLEKEKIYLNNSEMSKKNSYMFISYCAKYVFELKQEVI
mgnify:CR=1